MKRILSDNWMTAHVMLQKVLKKRVQFPRYPLFVCPLSCLGGDADAVLLHVHDGLRHFDRDGVSGELHVERPLELLRHQVQRVWKRREVIRKDRCQGEMFLVTTLTQAENKSEEGTFKDPCKNQCSGPCAWNLSAANKTLRLLAS